MEFYVFATKNCNLHCTYCSGAHESGAPDPKPEFAERIAEFILKASVQFQSPNKSGPRKPNVVVFHGGEPLLNQPFIKQLMQSTDGNGLQYLLQTNGTMLDSIDPYILGNLNYLSLSIDGNAIIHNKARNGSFEKVFSNYKKVRGSFHGHALARMTLLPENELFDSATFLLSHFDSVYWQIANDFGNNMSWNRFLQKYRSEIGRLADFWLEHMADGIVYGIVPFQALAISLLTDERHYTPRCGCGSYLVAIDVTGQCYACDELLDQSHRIGDVYSGINPSLEEASVSGKEPCKNCRINTVCGGRCHEAYLKLPKAQFRMYCRSTEILVDAVKSRLGRMQQLLGSNAVSMQQLHPCAFTEEIP